MIKKGILFLSILLSLEKRYNSDKGKTTLIKQTNGYPS